MTDAVQDPYAELARGMTPSLLVTFNDSTQGEPATGELEVTYVDADRPLVELRENDERSYRWFWDYGDEQMLLCELDDDGHQSNFQQTVSIEVVGVAE